MVFQYGRGLAAGDSLGKNGWGWANLDDTQSWRVVLDNMASLGDWEISTFAYYQKDKTTAGGRKTPKAGAHQLGGGDSPVPADHQNFAMQYELGYEYLDDKTTKAWTAKAKAA